MSHPRTDSTISKLRAPGSEGRKLLAPLSRIRGERLPQSGRKVERTKTISFSEDFTLEHCTVRLGSGLVELPGIF